MQRKNVQGGTAPPPASDLTQPVRGVNVTLQRVSLNTSIAPQAALTAADY